MGRSPCCDKKDHTNKGTWTKEEDDRLVKYIKAHGESCWTSLPKAAGIQSDGDVFHELISTRPHHVQNISPANIQGCDLHEGEFGKVGSVIIWKNSIDGKAMVAKQEIVAIDEEEKSVTFKVVEGHLLEEFKSVVISVHVDTKGEDNLVTWTFDYEKLNESVKDPTSYLDFFLSITRDIEAHHLPK